MRVDARPNGAVAVAPDPSKKRGKVDAKAGLWHTIIHSLSAWAAGIPSLSRAVQLPEANRFEGPNGSEPGVPPGMAPVGYEATRTGG